MTTTTAPPIAVGLPYSVQITVVDYDDVPFPSGCTLVGHVRDFAAASSLIAELTTGAGITRIGDATVQIDLTAAQTAAIRNTTVTIDFVRTDVDPDAYTYVQATIDAITPATRGYA